MLRVLTRGQYYLRNAAVDLRSLACYHVHSNTNELFQVSEEVASALHHGKPLVALESTIITHGMPYPDNVETAMAVESIVRENACVPATIAVLKGKICVGLSPTEIEWLGSRSDGLVKVSRRDFPPVLTQFLSGGTTVSATMMAAHRVGIPIFVTGGIGGVHRGAEDTMDISADLTELGRTSVAVVSAGVKSILDIGRTLEYLETQGVCVATYGRTREFPSFFTSSSGFLSPYQVESPRAAAGFIDANLKLDSESGILIAVPIPESLGVSGKEIESSIQTALQDMRELGISGKDVTPYILRRVNTLTDGASLQATYKDKALILNNADVGSRIARELQCLRENHKKGDNSTTTHQISGTKSSKTKSMDTDGNPVVVGGICVDFYVQFQQDDVQPNGGTYTGTLRQAFGGVGRNLADGLSRFGHRPLLVSAVGKGSHRGALDDYCRHMDLSAVMELEEQSTASYCGILHKSGEMMFGVGDMDVISRITPDLVSNFADKLSQAPVVCTDANIPPETIEYVCHVCAESGVPVWFEPTDRYKASKPFQTSAGDHLTYTSPNIGELAHMWAVVKGRKPDSLEIISPDSNSAADVIDACLPYCRDLTEIIPVVIVTLGCHGVLLCHRLGDKSVFPTKNNQHFNDRSTVLHYPACSSSQMPSIPVSVSGAGDCLTAGILSGIVQGYDIDLCMKRGLMAASYSLLSHHAVPATISTQDFTSERVKKWAPWDAKRIL